MDRDYDLRSISVRSAYDFSCWMFVNDLCFMGLPSAVNATFGVEGDPLPLAMPIRISEGSKIRVVASNYKRFKVFSNPVMVAFHGVRVIDDPPVTNHESPITGDE